MIVQIIRLSHTLFTKDILILFNITLVVH